MLYVDDVAAAARFLLATAAVDLVEDRPERVVLDASGLRLMLLPGAAATRGHDGREAGGAPLPAAELVLSAPEPAVPWRAALAAGAVSRMAPRSLEHGEAASVTAPGGLVVTWYARRA